MAAEKSKESFLRKRDSLILRPSGRNDLRMADGEDGRTAGGEDKGQFRL